MIESWQWTSLTTHEHFDALMTSFEVKSEIFYFSYFTVAECVVNLLIKLKLCILIKLAKGASWQEGLKGMTELSELIALVVI